MQIINLGAGPAKLPQEVIKTIQDELADWHGTGLSILEMSHRSPEFEAILQSAQDRLQRLLSIPDNYSVLFMQGGGTLQFSAVVYNLLGRKGKDAPVDYVITGSWSAKAASEAERLGANVRRIELSSVGENGQIVFRPLKSGSFSGPSASYVYYCDNETINGIEFPSTDCLCPYIDASVPIVCDMSSNFLSRPVDVSKFGLIFAGVQKNLGPAGITIVIVCNDLLKAPQVLPIPLMMDYRVFRETRSLYNTPPVFAIYAVDLVLRWVEDRFGAVEVIEGFSKAKAKTIYDAIAESDGRYVNNIPAHFRSRMNVVFRIQGREKAKTEALEEEFVKYVEAKGIIQAKGHRSHGGIRISLYNAITLEEAVAVKEAMFAFLEIANAIDTSKTA